ncbi:hypothetical protein ACT7DI_20620 [Bacillus paranthracis]
MVEYLQHLLKKQIYWRWGGLVGVADDFPREAGPPTRLKIIGGLKKDGQLLSLQRKIKSLVDVEVAVPTVLVVGTSAEVGKTRVTSSLIRTLTESGHAVGGVKLSGTGRMRDTQNYIQAGAVATSDYVDTGMDTTYGRRGQEVWESAISMSDYLVKSGAKDSYWRVWRGCDFFKFYAYN